MNSLPILGGALALASLLGSVERISLERSRRDLPHRIHVNGTRGKSTTTRLIRAALAEGGVRALSKTTGTMARYVLPDGREESIRRRSRANIREQVAALRRARTEGASAAVIECMALRPELQWISEHEMLRSTIGVITNARLDHVELMGRELREIARTLGNTVPENALLVTGDPLVAEVLAERARELGTTLILAQPLSRDAENSLPRWWAEDAGIALEVARRCGISDDAAMRGMATARPDPGAVRVLELAPGVQALDASAANDPASLLELVDEDGGRDRPLLFVYNHRSDRVPRLESFLRAGLPGDILITGEAPGGAVVKRLGHGRTGTKFVRRRELEAALGVRIEAARGAEKSLPRIVLCGNTKGFSPTRDLAPSPKRQS